jgi:hypothetical protein
MQTYTRTQTLIANLPYAVMLLTGAAVIARAFDFSAAALAGAAGYVAYGMGGAIWIMVFVCRCCAYYDTRSCPCGYGVLAARLVRKGAQECFAVKFKRHIPVIVPLWLIPPGCAAVAFHQGFEAGLAGLLGAFVLNSFVLLPLVSRRHACHECPQRESCPWMATGRAPS